MNTIRRTIISIILFFFTFHIYADDSSFIFSPSDFIKYNLNNDFRLKYYEKEQIFIVFHNSFFKLSNWNNFNSPVSVYLLKSVSQKALRFVFHYEGKVFIYYKTIILRNSNGKSLLYDNLFFSERENIVD